MCVRPPPPTSPRVGSWRGRACLCMRFRFSPFGLLHTQEVPPRLRGAHLKLLLLLLHRLRCAPSGHVCASAASHQPPSGLVEGAGVPLYAFPFLPLRATPYTGGPPALARCPFEVAVAVASPAAMCAIRPCVCVRRLPPAPEWARGGGGRASVCVSVSPPSGYSIHRRSPRACAVPI